MPKRNLILFGAVALLYILTGFWQSWNVSLNILNIGILSSIMALGVNMQWGYAGLFSTGIMGSVALGGLAVALISAPSVPAGFSAGGWRVIGSLAFGVAVIAASTYAWRHMSKGRARAYAVAAILIIGFFAFRAGFDPAVALIEANNPATDGNIGGFGLNALISWPVGGILAGLAAWAIGKVALSLRTDYLAIATLGIAEIVVTVMKSEDWLDRGVKNLISLPRPWPVPQEVDLQVNPEFLAIAARWGWDPTTASTIVVKLIYMMMFGAVLLAMIWLTERALKSPWGRMMRAIRDNEVAASAMGKNVTQRHLQIFIIGSAVIGVAGAMMTSMQGQLTPSTYSPLLFTFLPWIMVIVGGSGNNWGAVLGGLLLGWLWQIVETAGPQMMGLVTSFMSNGWLRTHLVDAAPHLRLLTLGVVLLLVMRFSPRGLIPEK